MKIRNKTMSGALLCGGLLLGMTGVSSAGTTTYNYTVKGTEHETFDDQGFCGPGHITIDGKFSLHVQATQADLTDEQILDALEGDDPNGIIVKVTYTETGSATDDEGAVVYTGTFSNWFGGKVDQNGVTIFSGAFNVRGTGTDGSHVATHDNSTVLFKNGEPVHELDHFVSHGCRS